MQRLLASLVVFLLAGSAGAQGWKLPLDPSSPVHPRRFGLADERVETIRGWYLWKKWDPDTWQAEVTKDPPGEVYQVRVLPWATTYRKLVYGARPDDLLPGERVNLFFAADDRHSRGYLVHFQDELGQMKGHGHSWEVRSITAGGFTARAMAGAEPLEDADRGFHLDPSCEAWRDGERLGRADVRNGDRLYLVWSQPDGRRIVHLMTDDASLPMLKKRQEERVRAEVAGSGMAGRIDGVDGTTVRFMAFATSWSQAGQRKPGETVRLSRVGKGYRAEGPTVEASVVSTRNRGSYASGVNDMVLEMSAGEDARRLAAWVDDPVVRLIPGP